MRNRQKQRKLKRQQKQEESIGKRSGRGCKDLTPYNAVRQIRTNRKANIALNWPPVIKIYVMEIIVDF